MITRERLQEVLHYKNFEGYFVWEVTQGRAQKGNRAGGLDDHGYIRIKIDGQKYRAHQLAWLWCTGTWCDQLDHKDLDKTNNVFSNLRPADHTQNNTNKPKQRNNTSGHKGVYWFEPRKRWRAVLYVGKKQKYLGTFTTKEAASEAYRVAAVKQWGEYARI